LLLELITRKLRWAQPLNSTGGLQLSLMLPADSEPSLTRQATERGIITPSLSALHSRPGTGDGWLLGFAALQPAEIEAAVTTLAKLKPPRQTS
jgi:GntR family transcriptional regulator/MocR family aminotransferase